MSMIKLGKGILISKHVSFASNGNAELIRAEKSDYYVQLVGQPTISSLSGKSELEEGKIKANQSALLEFGTVNPNKYHLCLEINPALYELALVNHQKFLEPMEGNQALKLFVHAKKEIDVGSIPWWIRIYGFE